MELQPGESTPKIETHCQKGTARTKIVLQMIGLRLSSFGAPTASEYGVKHVGITWMHME